MSKAVLPERALIDERRFYFSRGVKYEQVRG
jgi:hypothetical protein